MKIRFWAVGFAALSFPLWAYAFSPASIAASASTSVYGVLLYAYGDALSQLISLLQNGISQHQNPMVLAQMLGHQMMVVAGVGQGVVAQSTGTVVAVATPLLTITNVWFWWQGILFGIVIPAIPLVFFFMSALNWLLSVVGAITGVTLIAARAAATGRVAPAHRHPVMTLAVDAIFRPALTCMGFIFAGLVIVALSFPLYEAFAGVLSFGVTSLSGFASLLAFFVIFSRVLLSVVVRAFSLCLTLPDDALVFLEKRVIKLS